MQNTEIINVPKFLTATNMSSETYSTCPLFDCYCQTTCEVLGQCSCLNICETACQSCQSSCENCQTTCQVSCQSCLGSCLTGCQTTCEINFQATIPVVTINVSNLSFNSFTVYAQVSGGYTTLSIKLYDGNTLIQESLSSPVSYTGLTYGTTYTVVVYASNALGSDTKTRDVTTKQGKFYWRGGSNVDGSYKKGDYTTRLKASEWNLFLKAIKNRYKEQYGVFPSLNDVSQNSSITATQYNSVLSVLKKLSNVGSLPSEVTKDITTIEAEKHINSITVAFNSSILY